MSREEMSVEQVLNSLREHQPELVASIEAKQDHVLGLALDGELSIDVAKEMLVGQLLTRGEMNAVELEKMKLESKHMREAWEARGDALPWYRRWLAQAWIGLVEEVWCPTRYGRYGGWLACLLGFHLWVPVGEVDILGDCHLTGEEVCDLCHRVRKMSPEIKRRFAVEPADVKESRHE